MVLVRPTNIIECLDLKQRGQKGRGGSQKRRGGSEGVDLWLASRRGGDEVGD